MFNTISHSTKDKLGAAAIALVMLLGIFKLLTYTPVTYVSVDAATAMISTEVTKQLQQQATTQHDQLMLAVEPLRVDKQNFINLEAKNKQQDEHIKQLYDYIFDADLNKKPAE